MSDTWRRKRYYPKRVLLETADVLTPLFPDSLICLTGSELYMLRNVCQYLHRHSTFVSTYEPNSYLSPSNEEWDEIEAIVANLEEKLMGCSEIEQTLADILAAAQCACSQLTALQKSAWPAGGIHDGQPDYDDYASDVERDVGDPPGELEDWDAWDEYKCIAAQIVVDDTTNLASQLVNWYSAGAIITFELFQGLILGTALAPPVALALIIVEAIAVAGTAAAVTAVQNWMSTHKQDIVCCIYTADTLDDAKTALAALLAAEWDLLMGKSFFWGIMSDKQLSHIFDADLPTYADRSSNYSASYCYECDFPGDPLSWDQHFPPSTDWQMTGSNCAYDGSGHLQATSTCIWVSPTRVAMPSATYTGRCELNGYGGAPGFNCRVYVDYSPNAEDWTNWYMFELNLPYHAWGVVVDTNLATLWPAAGAFIRLRWQPTAAGTYYLEHLDVDFTPT